MLTAFHTAGLDVRVSVKRHSFTVSINGAPIYYFDLLGRLLGGFVDSRNYVRGLNGRLLEKRASYEDGIKGRIRRELSGEEKQSFLATMYQRILQIADGLQQGVLPAPDEPWNPERHSGLESLLRRVYSPEQLDQDARRFQTIYRPINILPPDQYLSVVLQVTEGCSHNKCTFCDFYKDRRFRIKTDAEVTEHIAQVKQFLGEAIVLRKTIFLADANAIVIPQRRLLHILDHVHHAFAMEPREQTDHNAWKAAHPTSFRGIYSFMDVFDSRHKSEWDFHALAERGLRRVYVGIETGSDKLLDFLQKAGRAQDAVYAVRALKEAGVQAGVIVMLGVGGDRFAEEHVESTIRILKAMQLGKGDIIYTSEFVEHPHSEYAVLAGVQGIRPLTRREMLVQREAIRSALTFDEGDKPRISNYDIREFVY